MTNLWLLAQMRQPGRSIYADLDRNTFIDFHEVFLDKDNFNFYKEVDGRPMISPSWSFCLSYELELRKEAVFRDSSSVVGSVAELRAPYEALVATRCDPKCSVILKQSGTSVSKEADFGP